ncbi:MAG: HD domain-containing protein [Oscillospiraceae bacterium]|jgi:tRNA nucleotidyltransferase (CCA-adding enzyme)|nr:HD domain-containing protein [Oscillospiraceae bacterium]
MAKRSIAIPKAVQLVLKTLTDAGFAAYAVGGCVRDSLRGKRPADWDICTSATPQQSAAAFSGQRVILTGARYGTVTLLRGGASFEITTFRSERGYSDSRHPDEVSFVSSLAEDLQRRDFTLNAMAADLRGRVIDPLGGAADLEQGIVRCVGDPRERFGEDALRIMRALRFASRFSFSVAPETAAAIHACRQSLQKVAAERLRKELDGLLTGENVLRILSEFTDVLCVLIPEIAACVGFRQYTPYHKFDVWQHTMKAVASAPPIVHLRLAALLHDIGKPCTFSFDKNLLGHFYNHAMISAAIARRVLRRLRYDNKTTQAVVQLIDLHARDFPETLRAMRRLLAKYESKTIEDLNHLKQADEMGKGTKTQQSIAEQMRGVEDLFTRALDQSASPLALRGEDLLALGVPEGRRLGDILRALQSDVCEGILPNERTALLESAQKRWQEFADFAQNSGANEERS